MPTVVFQGTDIAFQRIRQESPTTVFAGTDPEEVLEAVASSHNRIIGEFLMVPPGGTVTVTSATLTLFNIWAVPTSRTVQMRRILTDWIPGQASWNRRNTVPTDWAVPGLIGGADVGAIIATGTAPAAANTAFNLTGAGLIAYCQDVLNGGTDYGYLLNLIDDLTVSEADPRFVGTTENATPSRRPTLTIDYTTGGTPVNWTVSNPTVNSDAGTATVVVTLDAPAGAGGVNGFFSTYDITAAAGADYTARTAVPISIAAGQTTANLTVPIIP